MRRKVLSCLMAFLMVIGNFCFVSAVEEEKVEKAEPVPVGDTILAEYSTEKGNVGELDLNGTGLKEVICPSGDKALEMHLESYHQIGKLFEKPFEEGVYSFSFDFYAEDYVSEIVIRAYNKDATNYGDSANYAMVARFISDGNFIIYRDSSSNYTDDEIWYEIEKDKWNSMSVWIDTVNREICYWINGELWTTMPLHDKVISPKGFAIIHNASSKSDKKWYFDNIKICREISMKSGGLSPVYIDYKTGEEIIGNNFYTDLKPEFDLSLKNRTAEPINAEYFYRIKTFDGMLMYTSGSENITIPVGGTNEKRIKPDLEYYNRLHLEVVLKIDNKEYVKTIMYSYSNRRTSDRMNYFLGMNTHMYQQRGNPEDIVPLMGRAGIGNIREQTGSWNYYYDNGNKLDERAINHFKLCKEYGIRIMIMSSNAPVSMQEGDSRYVGEHHMKEFQDAVEQWAREYGEYVYALEVNNEPHNPQMTGQYHARFDVQADWLRHAYRGIKASGADTLVVGIDEDNAGFTYKPSTNYYEGTPYGDYGSYAEGIMDWLHGEQAMDVISIHPYPPTAEDQKGNNLVNLARDMMKKANLNPDIPIWFTESGFSEYNFNYDHKAVAAQAIRQMLRWQVGGLCDVWHYFHFVDNMRSAGTIEGYWGLCEDPLSGHAEVPLLGKQTYVATCYYNTLAADMEPVGIIDDENKYMINFKHRDGHDVIATGITDSKEETVGIFLGCGSATMSDMCGNEKTIYGIDGVFTIELKENEITYLQGNFEEPEFTDPKFTISNPVYTVPVAYAYDYTVSAPQDFDGTVTATAYGVELTRPTADINGGKASVELKTESIAQDSARIDINVTKDDKLYFYRWNEIEYSASGYVNNDSIKWRLAGNRDDLWNLSFTLENVRTDIPISGKMFVKETGKTYELPLIAPGTDRKITIPTKPIKSLTELGTINAQIMFNENDIFNLNLNSDIAVAKWTDTPPVIDGVIEKNEYTSDAVALVLADNKYVRGGIWNGVDDLNYKVYLTYDYDNLYMAIKIHDDVIDYSQAKFIEENWKNDSIQFQVGFNRGETGTSITHTMMNGEVASYRYYHENNILGIGGSDAKCVYDKSPCVIKQDGTEIVYEFSMPWDEVRLGYTGGIKQGQTVFFDINYNDSDGSGRRYWMDYTNSIGQGKAANNLATELILLPKN